MPGRIDWRRTQPAPQWHVFVRMDGEDFIWMGHADDAERAQAQATGDAQAAWAVLSGGHTAPTEMIVTGCKEVEEDDKTLAMARPSQAMLETCTAKRKAPLATIDMVRAKSIVEDILTVSASRADLPTQGTLMMRAGKWSKQLAYFQEERIVHLSFAGDVNGGLPIPAELSPALLALAFTCGEADRFSLNHEIEIPESGTLRLALEVDLQDKAPAAIARIAAFLTEVGLQAPPALLGPADDVASDETRTTA